MKKPIYDEKEVREICGKFELANLLRHMSNNVPTDTFETEISEDYNKRSGRQSHGTFTVPGFVLMNALKRSAISTSTAAALVSTDLLEEQYIQALAAQTVLGKAGVDTISGLVGDVAIPTGTGVNAAWFTTEGGPASEVTPSFSQKAATPHTVGGYADFTRRLMIQSTPAIERIIAAIITDAIARAIETAAFTGSGSSGQPLGLSGTTGVQSVTIDEVPTKAQLVEMWQKAFAENIHGMKCAYIGGAAMKGTLCKALDIHNVSNGLADDAEATVGAVTSGKYLCDGGKVEGYDYLMSNLCGNGLWFGDWSEMMLCAWSGVDLIVDKCSLSTSGGVRVIALQDVDLIVRQPKAFVHATTAE